MRESNIDELMQALRPIIGPRKAETIRQLYYVEDDPLQRQIVLCRAETMFSRIAKTTIDRAVILPPPLQKSAGKGDIFLGNTEYLGKTLYPFSLKTKDLNRHAGIFGATGTGKTTLAAKLIVELAKKKIPVIVIDWETSYRSLVKAIEGFSVFTVGGKIRPFYLNPLTVPAGITAHEYAKNIVNIISHDYLGGQGSDTILLGYVVQAYDELGVPVYSDLSNIIDQEIVMQLRTRGKLGGRSGLWKETVLRQNRFMSTGCIWDVLRTDRHVPIEVLVDRWTVLELGGLKSPHDRAFIAHFLLNQLLLYFQSRGIVSEELKLVVVMEEFHNLISLDEKKRDEPLLMIDTMFREIRKYGVGLVAVDQTPSQIPNGIMANINTKVCFSLSTSIDTLAMARAMNMKEDQFDYLGMLDTGKAVVRVKQRVAEPFVIGVPFDDPLLYVPDEELSRLMAGYSDYSVQVRPSDAKIIDYHNYQSQENIPPQGVAPYEKILLSDIAENPYHGVDVRAKRLGFHQTELTKAHQGLTDKKFIRPVTVDGKKLFEFTPGGKEQLEKFGFKMKQSVTRGGVVHAYSVQKVVQYLEGLGHSPKTEVDDIDVVDAAAGIGVEVETGKSNIVHNLKKLTSAKLKYRYCLGVDKEAEHAVKRLTDFVTGIRIMSVREFVKLSNEDLMSPQQRLFDFNK